jgi:hypothetical protein
MLALKYIVGTIVLGACLHVLQKAQDLKPEAGKDTVFEQAIGGPVQTEDTISLPRNGKYLIESFGYNETKPLKIGYFTLRNNEYKYYDLEDNLIDSGTYLFDAPSKQIKWQTGRFKKIGWSGNFVAEQNGKVHTVHLNNTTVAKNTIQ